MSSKTVQDDVKSRAGDDVNSATTFATDLTDGADQRDPQDGPAMNTDDKTLVLNGVQNSVTQDSDAAEHPTSADVYPQKEVGTVQSSIASALAPGKSGRGWWHSKRYGEPPRVPARGSEKRGGGFLAGLFSMGKRGRQRELARVVNRIEALWTRFEAMSNEELAGVTLYLRGRYKRGETLDELLPEAFAAVREASERVLGMRHFPVQLMGGVVLHKGMIAEMKTGEGKTLVAPLAAYLNAIPAKGVHIVTVNDYLAKRDSEWMGRVYGFLGMSVGCLQNGMNADERHDAYAADVTYGTNSEFGFDYLRDNMVMNANERVQRGHTFAIIDEADSILIDEARTPLIISGFDLTSVEPYIRFARVVAKLSESDVAVDEAKHIVYATEEGLHKIEKWLVRGGPIPGLDISMEGTAAAEGMLRRDESRKGASIVYLNRGGLMDDRPQQSLRARFLVPGLGLTPFGPHRRFARALSGLPGDDALADGDDEGASIVYLNRGGLMDDRPQQSLRARFLVPGLGLTPFGPHRRFARALSGLPGDDALADGDDEGAGIIYSDRDGLMANHLLQSLRARFLFHRDDQYVVSDDEVKIVDEFTGRILKGRRYSEGLHQAIEAKEGVKIRHESVTMATVTLQNYFRLYDKLSGMTGTARSADAELRETYGTPVVTIPTNRPVIREDREDYVFLTRQDKLRAVADEVGRRHAKGQPVLVGTTSVEASEELDRLMEERGIPHQTLNAKDPGREAAIVANAGKVGAVTIATNMAGRGTDIILGGSREGYVHEKLRQLGAKDSKSALLWQLKQADEYTRTQMKRQGDVVRDLGGLLVIGTERHDSRRIDDQLRGRSGRQGDPGESRFYLSLEDRLLRLHGKGCLDAMARVMRRVGLGEGEPAEDRSISKQVTKAQERVESMHYGMRKQVLDYDDVMDRQRRAVYAERDAILDGADIEGRAIGHARDIIGAIVEETCGGARRKGERDVDGLNAWVGDMTGDESFDAAELGEDAGELADGIEAAFAERWDARREAMGEEAFGDLCRRALLRSLDQHWVDHLVDMDHLKQGMGLRGLAQRDPLVEYKREAFDSFRDLVREIYADFLRIMLRLEVEGDVKADEVVPEKENPFREENLSYSRSGESTIQDDSDLSAMAGVTGGTDAEADD